MASPFCKRLFGICYGLNISVILCIVNRSQDWILFPADAIITVSTYAVQERGKGMHRLYANEDITVFWNSDKCFHAKKCVTGCPEAFDITRKPWINIDNAPTQKVWQAVSKCPSGALTVTYNHDVEIRYAESENRSLALSKGQIIGECDYEVTAEGWEIYHTEVDKAYADKGIARRLVYTLLQEAERRKCKVIPVCSYAVKVLEE